MPMQYSKSSLNDTCFYIGTSYTSQSSPFASQSRAIRKTFFDKMVQKTAEKYLPWFAIIIIKN